MRGRRQGLGNYTLGDRYITPDRRLSQILMRQGSRGGPSDSWQETLGRIAQQLSGAYIGKQDQDKQDIANQAFAKVEPDSFRPPTDAEAMATPGMRDLELSAMTGIAGDGRGQTYTPNDQQLMQMGGIPGTLDKISRYDAGLSGDSNRSADDIMGDQTLNAGIDLQAKNLEKEMTDLRVEQPRDFKAELAQGMQDYQADDSNRIMNEKMPQIEYAMQNLRGLENNPYAQRLLQGLMMNQMNTDAASRLDATARERQLADATTAYDRKNELGQMPMSPEQFEQKQKLIRPTRPQFTTTAEGVYSVNADGSLGARVGSAPSQFGYTQGNVPASEQPQQAGGIPTGSAPWAGLPIKEQAKMQQSSYKEAAKMLEKNRQSLVSNQTMSDSLKRFAYLNDKQDKEAENEYFGTKTGSLIDRMPLGGLPSFDDEKIEMESISSFLTPQMRQGMPGAASDRDVAMFANATVGINRPKEINDNLIAGMSARFENASDRQAFMEEFLTQNKHLNGAEQEWRGYLEANPIFDPDPSKEGQYALNKFRKGYKEYFSGGRNSQTNQSRRSTDKKERRSTDIPEGVSKEQWGVMSPEQKALFK